MTQTVFDISCIQVAIPPRNTVPSSTMGLLLPLFLEDTANIFPSSVRVYVVVVRSIGTQVVLSPSHANLFSLVVGSFLCSLNTITLCLSMFEQLLFDLPG